VCFRIRDSICAASTPLHACIARLLLLSDILFNRYPMHMMGAMPLLFAPAPPPACHLTLSAAPLTCPRPTTTVRI
jgi:hypothetical protein